MYFTRTFSFEDGQLLLYIEEDAGAFASFKIHHVVMSHGQLASLSVEEDDGISWELAFAYMSNLSRQKAREVFEALQTQTN